jgi:hypothetical protein
MLKTSLLPPRLTSRTARRVLRAAFLGLCAIYVASCRSDRGVAPLPLGDGPVTGTWIQPSVDTWTQLDLSQSGDRVVGYYRTGSANFGGSLSDPIWITGTTALPHAALQWTENGVQRTMNATLSSDGDSLTGTWSTPGQPGIPFFRFQRSTK